VTTYLKEYLNTVDKEEDDNNEQQHSVTAIENMCVKALQTINHQHKPKHSQNTSLCILIFQN
jgi:hypothetical protein